MRWCDFVERELGSGVKLIQQSATLLLYFFLSLDTIS